MKTSLPLLACLALSLAPLSVRAQVVADGATNTLSNVTTNFTGDVTVGTNGSFTLLMLSDNALLTNSVNGVIGLNLPARSNEVRLISPTARWRMGGFLFVGSNGVANRLVVGNGAFVNNNSSGFLGNRVDSSNNFALVTGGGSLWSNRLNLTVGSQGRGNQLVVSNGGWVASQNGFLGNNASASNNFALVTGSGSVWSNTSTLDVGSSGPGNRLVIEAGGRAHCDGGYVGHFLSASNNEALVTGPGSLWTNFSFLTIGLSGGFNRLVVSNGATVWSGTGGMGSTSSASNNQVVVTGAGSVWSNQTDLVLGGSAVGNRVDVNAGGAILTGNGTIGASFGANNSTVVLTDSGSVWNSQNSLIVGQAGNGNVLLASNGATVLSSNATIGVNGSTANNNLASITGAGTLWSNRNDFVVGSSGVGNRLVVSNGATVLSGNLFIGFNSLSADNRVTVDGGTLRVTNASGTGVLDVRRGTNILNAGLIEVDKLLLTNSAGRFEFNGGTLSLGQSTIANGLSFGVGDGASPATLNLTGNGTHSFASDLIVRSNATVMGNGTILAPIITTLTGSKISPGTAPGDIGRLSSSGSVHLGGFSHMEISKSGGALTNDQFQAASFTYIGGLVIAIKIGPDALTAGDRFQLFVAGSYGLSGANFLPGLAPGLRWVNNLGVDGSIEVESLAPSVTTLPASALTQTSGTLNGVANPKGTNTSGWFEFGFSTNYGFVTPPQALGSVDGDTNFSDVIASLIPSVSYHFRAVASNSFGVDFGGDQSFPRLAQRDYLKASDTSQFFGFGRSVAMSGDTLVVAGVKVYVFVRQGNSWAQQTSFFSGQSISSVAISGDTLVVGDPGDDNNSGTTVDAGAAQVFVHSGTTWSKQATLRASNLGAFDHFGQSVAVSGDTIVIGAPLEDSNATGVNGDQSDNSAGNSGAAYVFVRSGTNWTQQAYLKASNTESSDEFGLSVGLSGDTIVVGATDADNGGANDTGAAYVFVRSGANWSQQAVLVAGNSGFFDEFGTSVAISGDTIVAGAIREDSDATGVNGVGTDPALTFDSGAAYIFVRNGTAWTQQAYLKASNTGSNDFFGTSVAVSGDFVIVGANGEDSNAIGVNGDGTDNLASSAGAAYVFAREGTTWSFLDYLKASNTEANDSFGQSVAVSGGYFVVGANGEDSNAVGVNGDQNSNSLTNSGAAYVFGSPLPPVAEINVSQSGTNILNGGVSQGYLVAGTNTQNRSFTIKNTGNDFLTGLTITFDGPDAAKFTVTLNPIAPLTPTSNTTFTVRFAPTSPGTNTATLHIASNDEDENPFNIQLSGLSLSFTEDRDGDGLNDASELLMAALGFNFQVNQTSLVNTLFNNVGGAVSNLNAAGFFTQSQLQALNVDTPLLAKDPNTGLFKLTIGVEKATQLTNFFPFPMTAPQTTINAEGKLEFQFTSPDGAAFFRLEAQ